MKHAISLFLLLGLLNTIQACGAKFAGKSSKKNREDIAFVAPPPSPNPSTPDEPAEHPRECQNPSDPKPHQSSNNPNPNANTKTPKEIQAEKDKAAQSKDGDSDTSEACDPKDDPAQQSA